MSTGIYKYQNKINGHIYIGQSVNIEKRYAQHLYDAYNRPITTIDIAINKYGINNFTFEIVEECSVKELNNKEIYWIDFYDSFNNGYNNTLGGKSLNGGNHPRSILKEQDVWFIRECYKNHIPRREVFKSVQSTGITERGFLKVWNNETWPEIHQDVYTKKNKLWHKQNVGHGQDQVGLSSLDRAIKQEDIDIWIKEKKAGLSINAIAKKYNRDNSTIEKYINNPKAISEVKYTGRKLQNVNTGKIFNSISSAAKWAKCGATTLTRHLTTDKIAGKVPETGEPASWIELS